MHASDSHIASSMPYALRFHREGHYVEFLETHEKPQPYNYPLGINNTYIQLESKHSYEALFRAVWRNYFGAQVFSSVFLVGENVLRQIFETQRAEIEKFLEKKYDLLIIDEIFSILGYGLGLKRREEGIPFLTMASCASTNIMQHHLSLGNNFITRPSYFGLPTKQFDPARFSSRLDTFWESVSDLLLVEHALQNHAQEGVKNLGLAGFEYKDIARKTSFYLYDEITFLVGSETLLVGFHCAKFATLSGEYLEHVEHPGSKGTILIAFGTNVKWEFAPAELILAFVDALNSLPEFRVIWTYNGLPEHVKDLKSHVLLTKWAPQKEILKHEKTVAFVSHGGMKSVKDTICAGVPVVFMPILAEQSLNAEMCRQAGFGVTLAKTEVTVEKLRDALLTVTALLQSGNAQIPIILFRPANRFTRPRNVGGEPSHGRRATIPDF
ncbi:unnamed protein product, partial [Mesorhabditis spiculigera]